MQFLVRYFLIFFLMVSLFACSSAKQSNPTVHPPSNTVLSANRPTISATSIATITIVPPSSTPFPTLEPQAAEFAIKQMLNQETSCTKPCLFGIIPNQTKLEEVQNFYEHLNMNFGLTYQEGKKQYYEAGFGFDDKWGIIVTNIVEDGIVRNITLGLSFVNYTGSILQQEWPAFRPDTILAKYGQPSDIELNLSFPVESGFPRGTAWYDAIMYFPESDLIVKYSYELTNAGAKVLACPLTDKSLGMNMWLGKEPQTPPGGIASLDKATTISLEEFYNLLTQNSQKACFELNQKIFFPEP